MRALPRLFGTLVALRIALLSAPCTPADEPVPPADAREFVARVIDAHGGWTRLEGVRALRVEGKVFSIRRHDEAPTVRVLQRPDRLKILILYDDGHEARLLDGRRGWRAIEGGAFETSAGPMLDAMVLQCARSEVPWVLHDHTGDARLIEPFEHAGERLPGIEVTLDSGLVLRAYVDPATWRVRMSQGVLPHGGMQTHFETFYEDYRESGGVWFAYHEENWASGVHTGSTTLEKVIVNPRLAKDEFAPAWPKGGRRPSGAKSS